MNHIVVCYVIYLVVSVVLTVWVANTLHRNGRIFLVQAFHGNEAMADSVNHGGMHFFNMFNFDKMRRKGKASAAEAAHVAPPLPTNR